MRSSAIFSISKKKFNIICKLGIVLFLILSGCQSKNDKDKNIVVSIKDLSSSPEKYDNKLVETTGYIHFGFEDDFIFKDEKDFIEKKYNRAIRIDKHNSQMKEADLIIFSDHLVNLVGKFNAASKNYYSVVPGEIRVISIKKQSNN